MAHEQTANGGGRRVSPAEFARIANVNRSTVHRWGQNGRITIGPDGKIDLEAALRERSATESPEPRHQARKEQFDEQKAAPGPMAPGLGEGISLGGGGVVERLGLMHKQAALKRLVAQAELANLELDRAAKALYERVDVDYVLHDFGVTLADKLNSLPDRYTSELAACRGDTAAIHKTLEDAAHNILAELNDHLNRQREALDAT